MQTYSSAALVPLTAALPVLSVSPRGKGGNSAVAIESAGRPLDVPEASFPRREGPGLSGLEVSLRQKPPP
jgi:hypothetical protein